ncbi:unnamed protein product [Brassicogethes aeneus]|uniref:Alpha-1,6-mannosyl-glycoprotein 2-beta-N-acetylglucosaminyltransferase n=1 Tax=Brassicogethes aeneus TaxID=1431903 RepID=A0A9P0B8C1_BRAAE|nr:unnamed protein product [Brassicogethes aeneus]
MRIILFCASACLLIAICSSREIKKDEENHDLELAESKHHHESGGGSSHHGDHHSSHGDKGDKGYKSMHHHDKGGHGKHGKHHHASHHAEKGGHHKSHHDEAGHYGEHHSSGKKHKGGKWGGKKGHKKGQKTTGFHHKSHKDDYHKNHKFYDDHHVGGHHSKHGSFHGHHGGEEGHHKKGGSHKSGYHDDHFGKKGHSDKGHYDEDHKGYKGHGGHESHHSHHSDYGKKGDHSDGKHWGFKSEYVLEINKIVSEINEIQFIRNEELFEPLQENDYVVVIQVHNRENYLRHVIESHSRAKHIDKVLMIFSHDVYDDNINEIIANITFCKVMQIFYPFSIQIYPDDFPGDSPNDCPRDIGIQKAKEINCTNAFYPDSFGHYREATFTQIKHHWWWKLNKVFLNLRITKNFNGYFIFLEDDHYVTEDYLHVLDKMTKECFKYDCTAMGLGDINGGKQYGEIEKVKLSPGFPNMGLVFKRTLWNLIKSCAKTFCEYDDYNWDVTLNYLYNVCLNSSGLTLSTTNSRVYHIGSCGLHHHGICDPVTQIQGIETTLNQSKLYPNNVKLSNIRRRKSKMNNNGGWGDIRDHYLCFKMTL